MIVDHNNKYDNFVTCMGLLIIMMNLKQDLEDLKIEKQQDTID